MNKCARCIHSTNSDKCPWATRFDPVPGWDAVPTVLSANQSYRQGSYHIKFCPLYEKGHKQPEYDLNNAKKLIAETIRQAVDDWKLLDYGRIEEKRIVGQVVKSSELLAFFKSEEFEAMYKFVTNRSPDYARCALKIHMEGADA